MRINETQYAKICEIFNTIMDLTPKEEHLLDIYKNPYIKQNVDIQGTTIDICAIKSSGISRMITVGKGDRTYFTIRFSLNWDGTHVLELDAYNEFEKFHAAEIFNILNEIIEEMSIKAKERLLKKEAQKKAQEVWDKQQKFNLQREKEFAGLLY